MLFLLLLHSIHWDHYDINIIKASDILGAVSTAAVKP